LDYLLSLSERASAPNVLEQRIEQYAADQVARMRQEPRVWSQCYAAEYDAADQEWKSAPADAIPEHPEIVAARRASAALVAHVRSALIAECKQIRRNLVRDRAINHSKAGA